MKKNDWIGITVSLVCHGLLVFLFSLLSVAATDPIPVGFVEIDFGPVSEGKPVRKANPARTEATLTAERTKAEKAVAELRPPNDVRPVDLPNRPQQAEDPDVVPEQDAENISPSEVTEQEDVIAAPPIAPPTRSTDGAGDAGGSAGDRAGNEGPGTDDKKSAPFEIEGLNRIPVAAPLPRYAEKVNAVIRVRIIVDPQGRIIQRIPLLKGNPALEKSIMETLRNWRFNPLPPNAPQETQSGTVTFRFRLE